MTINGLHHAAISTPNIERLMKWYTKNFGFEEVSRSEWPIGSKTICLLYTSPSPRDY